MDEWRWRRCVPGTVGDARLKAPAMPRGANNVSCGLERTYAEPDIALVCATCHWDTIILTITVSLRDKDQASPFLATNVRAPSSATVTSHPSYRRRRSARPTGAPFPDAIVWTR